MTRLQNLSSTQITFSLEQTLHDLDICIHKKTRGECAKCFHSKICLGGATTLFEDAFTHLKQLNKENTDLRLRVNELTDFITSIQGGSIYD